MSDNLQETIRESAKAPAKASGDAVASSSISSPSRSLLTSIWRPRQPPLNRSVAFVLTSSCHRVRTNRSQPIRACCYRQGVGFHCRDGFTDVQVVVRDSEQGRRSQRSIAYPWTLGPTPLFANEVAWSIRRCDHHGRQRSPLGRCRWSFGQHCQ